MQTPTFCSQPTNKTQTFYDNSPAQTFLLTYPRNKPPKTFYSQLTVQLTPRHRPFTHKSCSKPQIFYSQLTAQPQTFYPYLTGQTLLLTYPRNKPPNLLLMNYQLHPRLHL